MLTVAEYQKLLRRVVTTTCWLWQGACDKGGYGKVKRWGKTHKVHRLIYAYHNGTIPPDKELANLCGAPACCRPEHWEPQTHRAIMQRTHPRRSHCKHGHEMTTENSVRRNNGTVHCRMCDLMASRRWRLERAAVRAARVRQRQGLLS